MVGNRQHNIQVALNDMKAEESRADLVIADTASQCAGSSSNPG